MTDTAIEKKARKHRAPDLTARQIVQQLKEKATVITDTLRFRELATPEEIAAYWPGGEENQGHGAMAWAFAYGNMIRFCNRLEQIPNRRAAASADADQVILKSLGDSPVSVELDAPPGESPLSVSVFPKSFLALERIDLHDRAIGWLNEQRAKLLAQSLAVTGDVLEVIGPEITRQYALIAWAATHPAPGLPFGTKDAPNEIPEWLLALSPADLLRIHAAFIEVNLLRLHALYALLKVATGDEGTGRPTWASFFAMRSEESNVPTSVLMSDRSLASQVATALTAADVREKSLEEAKRKSA